MADFGISESLIAYGALATAAVGTAASVYGGIQQAHAQSQQAAYQAQIAANNATIARQNAAAATQAGQSKAEAEGLKRRAILGEIVAGESATGVDVNTGSDIKVRESQRVTGLEDRATTEHNSFLQAYGYQSQATGFQAQSGLESAVSSQATALAPISALSTTAGGLSQLGTKYTQFSQSGALTGGGGGLGADY